MVDSGIVLRRAISQSSLLRGRDTPQPSLLRRQDAHQLSLLRRQEPVRRLGVRIPTGSCLRRSDSRVPLASSETVVGLLLPPQERWGLGFSSRILA
jgi:hypothetical protein